MDDGSTDGSLNAIRSFEGRVRCEMRSHVGGNAARNRLLQLARGDWLQYLDADDYILPEKTAKQIEFVRAHPHTDILFSPVTLEHWSENCSRLESRAVPEPHDPWLLLARWYLPGTGSGIWRKQSLLDVGGWNEQQPCCQEHELYLRLLMADKRFRYCPHGGYIYRQWGEHTVCKRNKPEVHRRRLDIEKQAEQFLRKTGQLTPQRLHAINQARFETARSAWQYSPAFAAEIIKIIESSQPGFNPAGAAAPLHYSAMYRLFGFRTAERLAGLKRSLWSVPDKAGAAAN